MIKIFFQLTLILFYVYASPSLATAPRGELCALVFSTEAPPKKPTPTPKIQNTAKENLQSLRAPPPAYLTQAHSKIDFSSTFALDPKLELMRDLNPNNPDASPWSVLVRLIRQWIIDEGYFQTQALVRSDQFYIQDLWKSKDTNSPHTQLEISSFPLKRAVHANPTYWGLELAQGSLEKDGFKAQLNVTISIAKNTSLLYLFLQSSHETSPQFQGPPPKLKIMSSLHRSLYKNIKQLFQIQDGIGYTVPKESAQTLSQENALQFIEKLTSPYRVYPIVLLSTPKSARGRSSNSPLLDQNRLAQFLFGIAEVYHLPNDPILYQNLSEFLGPHRFLLVQNGDMRIISKDLSAQGYWPSTSLQTSNKEFVLSQIRAVLIEKSRSAALMPDQQTQATLLSQIHNYNEQLKKQNTLLYIQNEIQINQSLIQDTELMVKEVVQNKKDYETLDQMLQKLLINLKNLQETIAELNSSVDDQTEVKMLIDELQSLELQSEILKEDVLSLKPFLNSTNKASARIASGAKENLDLNNPPVEFEKILHSISNHYKTRVLFADEAYGGEKDLKNFLKIKENRIILYKVLAHIPTTLWSLYKDHSKSLEVDFKKAMLENEILHVDLARGESHKTVENNTLARQRYGSHGGKVYKGFAHIRYNNGSNNIFRIHYVFDHESQKIVVTRITDHLEVFSGTR